MNPFITKTISSTIAITLLCTNVLFAHRLSLPIETRHSVPEGYSPDNNLIIERDGMSLAGIVNQNRNAFVEYRDPSLKHAGMTTLLHIQDVHLNQEAQRDISNVIRSLIENNQVDLIALEGAFDSIDLKRFQEFPNKQINQRVSDFLLSKNKIQGPIHALLNSAIVPVIGIDDRTHYRANVQATKDAALIQETMRAKLDEAGTNLRTEKQNVFNKDLLAFDQKVEMYRNEQLSFGDYVRAIERQAGSQIHLAVETFIAALDLEQSLNFTRVETERAIVIGDLLKKLNEHDAKTLLDLSTRFRSGSVKHTELYTTVREFCRTYNVSLAPYQTFDNYIRYVLLSDAINAENLFVELRELEQRAYAVLTTTDEERALVAESRRLYLTGKLVEFALTKEEWEEYTLTRPPATLSLQGEGRVRAEPFERFYKEAETRDRRMAENLLAAIKKHNAKKVLLVTGGFHTKGIHEAVRSAQSEVRSKDISSSNHALRTTDFSYMTFTPRITKLDTENGSSYLSVFAQEKTPLEKLFQGDKLFLPPPVLERSGRITLGFQFVADALHRLNPQSIVTVTAGRHKTRVRYDPDGHMISLPELIPHKPIALFMNYFLQVGIKFFNRQLRAAQNCAKSSWFNWLGSMNGNNSAAAQINLMAKNGVATSLAEENKTGSLKGAYNAMTGNLRQVGHQAAISLINTWRLANDFLSSSMDHKYNLMAFLMLASVCFMVSPWEAHPGSSGTYAENPPSFSFSITTLYFISIILSPFVLALLVRKEKEREAFSYRRKRAYQNVNPKSIPLAIQFIVDVVIFARSGRVKSQPSTVTPIKVDGWDLTPLLLMATVKHMLRALFFSHVVAFISLFFITVNWNHLVVFFVASLIISIRFDEVINRWTTQFLRLPVSFPLAFAGPNAVWNGLVAMASNSDQPTSTPAKDPTNALVIAQIKKAFPGFEARGLVTNNEIEAWRREVPGPNSDPTFLQYALRLMYLRRHLEKLGVSPEALDQAGLVLKHPKTFRSTPDDMIRRAILVLNEQKPETAEDLKEHQIIWLTQRLTEIRNSADNVFMELPRAAAEASPELLQKIMPHLMTAERMALTLLVLQGALPTPKEGNVISHLHGINDLLFEQVAGIAADYKALSTHLPKHINAQMIELGFSMDLNAIAANKKPSVVADFRDAAKLLATLPQDGLPVKTLFLKHAERFFVAQLVENKVDEQEARRQYRVHLVKLVRALEERYPDLNVVVVENPDEAKATTAAMIELGYHNTLPEQMPKQAYENIAASASFWFFPVFKPKGAKRFRLGCGGMIHNYQKENFLVPYSEIPIDWAKEFGNSNPLIVEVGHGEGRVLLREATDHPENNYIGIEVEQHPRIDESFSGLKNVRFIRRSAFDSIPSMFKDETISEYLVLFPFPYKIAALPLPNELQRKMKNGGRVTIVTEKAANTDHISKKLADVMGSRPHYTTVDSDTHADPDLEALRVTGVHVAESSYFPMADEENGRIHIFQTTKMGSGLPTEAGPHIGQSNIEDLTPSSMGWDRRHVTAILQERNKRNEKPASIDTAFTALQAAPPSEHRTKLIDLLVAVNDAYDAAPKITGSLFNPKSNHPAAALNVRGHLLPDGRVDPNYVVNEAPRLETNKFLLFNVSFLMTFMGILLIPQIFINVIGINQLLLDLSYILASLNFGLAMKSAGHHREAAFKDNEGNYWPRETTAMERVKIFIALWVSLIPMTLAKIGALLYVSFKADVLLRGPNLLAVATEWAGFLSLPIGGFIIARWLAILIHRLWNIWGNPAAAKLKTPITLGKTKFDVFINKLHASRKPLTVIDGIKTASIESHTRGAILVDGPGRNETLLTIGGMNRYGRVYGTIIHDANTGYVIDMVKKPDYTDEDYVLRRVRFNGENFEDVPLWNFNVIPPPLVEKIRRGDTLDKREFLFLAKLLVCQTDPQQKIEGLENATYAFSLSNQYVFRLRRPDGSLVTLAMKSVKLSHLTGVIQFDETRGYHFNQNRDGLPHNDIDLSALFSKAKAPKQKPNVSNGTPTLSLFHRLYELILKKKLLVGLADVLASPPVETYLFFELPFSLVTGFNWTMFIPLLAGMLFLVLHQLTDEDDSGKKTEQRILPVVFLYTLFAILSALLDQKTAFWITSGAHSVWNMIAIMVGLPLLSLRPKNRLHGDPAAFFRTLQDLTALWVKNRKEKNTDPNPHKNLVSYLDTTLKEKPIHAAVFGVASRSELMIELLIYLYRDDRGTEPTRRTILALLALFPQDETLDFLLEEWEMMVLGGKRRPHRDLTTSVTIFANTFSNMAKLHKSPKPLQAIQDQIFDLLRRRANIDEWETRVQGLAARRTRTAHLKRLRQQIIDDVLLAYIHLIGKMGGNSFNPLLARFLRSKNPSALRSAAFNVLDSKRHLRPLLEILGRHYDPSQVSPFTSGSRFAETLIKEFFFVERNTPQKRLLLEAMDMLCYMGIKEPFLRHKDRLARAIIHMAQSGRLPECSDLMTLVASPQHENILVLLQESPVKNVQLMAHLALHRLERDREPVSDHTLLAQFRAADWSGRLEILDQLTGQPLNRQRAIRTRLAEEVEQNLLTTIEGLTIQPDRSQEDRDTKVLALTVAHRAVQLAHERDIKNGDSLTKFYAEAATQATALAIRIEDTVEKAFAKGTEPYVIYEETRELLEQSKDRLTQRDFLVFRLALLVLLREMRVVRDVMAQALHLGLLPDHRTTEVDRYQRRKTQPTPGEIAFMRDLIGFMPDRYSLHFTPIAIHAKLATKDFTKADKLVAYGYGNEVETLTPAQIRAFNSRSDGFHDTSFESTVNGIAYGGLTTFERGNGHGKIVQQHELAHRLFGHFLYNDLIMDPLSPKLRRFAAFVDRWEDLFINSGVKDPNLRFNLYTLINIHLLRLQEEFSSDLSEESPANMRKKLKNKKEENSSWFDIYFKSYRHLRRAKLPSAFGTPHYETFERELHDLLEKAVGDATEPIMTAYVLELDALGRAGAARQERVSRWFAVFSIFVAPFTVPDRIASTAEYLIQQRHKVAPYLFIFISVLGLGLAHWLKQPHLAAMAFVPFYPWKKFHKELPVEDEHQIRTIILDNLTAQPTQRAIETISGRLTEHTLQNRWRPFQAGSARDLNKKIYDVVILEQSMAHRREQITKGMKRGLVVVTSKTHVSLKDIDAVIPVKDRANAAFHWRVRAYGVTSLDPTGLDEASPLTTADYEFVRFLNGLLQSAVIKFEEILRINIEATRLLKRHA